MEIPDNAFGFILGAIGGLVIVYFVRNDPIFIQFTEMICDFLINVERGIQIIRNDFLTLIRSFFDD